MENDKGSPRPWCVLEVEDEPFVATRAYQGHPYFNHTRFVDILGDEDYPKKREDCELIVRCVNNMPMVIRTLRIISQLPTKDGCISDGATVIAKQALEVVDPK